jgi:hypothetical protein
MFWHKAIRAGSSVCSHAWNELIAARRWLRVEMLLFQGRQQTICGSSIPSGDPGPRHPE